jgi:hypothetical protein
MTVEAIEMKLVTTAPATAVPTWMVHLRVEYAAAGRPAPGEDELEPMVELMQRTDGVCAAAVVPLDSAGLAVAVGLSAPDAVAALERARELVAACARYAGLGAVTVHRAGVAPRPRAGGSGGRADA